MVLFAKLTYWRADKGFGFLEAKLEDRSLQRFFLHVSNISKCFPEGGPSAGCLVRFEGDPNFTPEPGSKHAPLARNAEIFWGPEKTQQAPTTKAVL